MSPTTGVSAPRLPVPRSAGFVVSTTLFAVVAMLVASAALWPVYQHPRFWLVVGAGIGLGALIGVAGSVWRLPSIVVLLATVAAFLATGVQTSVPEAAVAGGLLPTGAGIVQLLSASALGWRQLVTITLPVGDYQSLLVPAYLSLLVATVVSVSVALRARRGELGAVPPVLVYVIGILFGPTRATDAIPLSLLFVVVLLLWTVQRRVRRRRDALRVLSPAEHPDLRRERSGAVRLIGSALVSLAIAAGVAFVAAGSTPAPSRTVLRSVADQPFDPRDYASPLSSFRRYLKDGRDDEAMLGVEGLPAGARVRIATLDSYDGVVYAVGSSTVDSDSGTFSRVPTSVSRPASAGSDPVDVRVRVEGYRGVWLPTVGDLETVEFSGADAAALRGRFYFNDTSSTAAVLGGLRAGDGYRLTAELPRSDGLDDLEDATPGAARVPRLEGVPDAVGTRLEQYARGADGAGAQLVAAIRGLRRDGYISHGLGDDEPPSRSGHGADRITELLSEDRMVGDAEQYAVAAALMARQVGFPARVVMGFAAGDRSGEVTLRGKDITAWIEVDTAGSGWVTVDPVPPVRPIPEEQPKEPAPVARPQTPVEPPPDEPQRHDDQSPPDTQQSDQDAQDPILVALLAVGRVAGISALALLVLTSPLLLIAAAKARRRRLRRRAPTPVDRVRGAWDEFRDEALDHGWVAAPTATRSEFAERVGFEQSKTLAAVADRAVFSPEAVEKEEADRVWIALDDLSVALGRGLSRRDRFRARVSVRSLGGFGVRRLRTRDGERR